MTQPNLINLHRNEYIQGIRYYPFAVNWDRCKGSFNILDDLSNRVCIPDKTEDLKLYVFNMIAGIKESKALTKHITCKCKFKFDGSKYNSNQKWNNDKCWCESLEEYHLYKKY